MILFQLFLSFVQVGLFSVGGGYAAMPLIQNEVVLNHGWLTMNEFTDLITIAEMTPGPIAVNSATFVGIRIAGVPGAVIATLGCVFPSLILVSVLTFVYYRYKKLNTLQSVLTSLRPAVVALIASAGFGIWKTAVFQNGVASAAEINWIGMCSFLLAFTVLRKKKWNPILVMSACGVIGMLAYNLPI